MLDNTRIRINNIDEIKVDALLCPPEVPEVPDVPLVPPVPPVPPVLLVFVVVVLLQELNCWQIGVTQGFAPQTVATF